jgi:hypothetical protein
MQEIRRFKPSTVSRRFSIVAGFYRTAVIDGVLDYSPAEHVRRPAVPAESPTLGFTHLQFEAMLTASRESANPCDFALVAMLGLLGLRIFEATSANIADLGEEHGHRVLRVCGKGTKVVLIPLPPAVGRAIDRAIGGRSAGPIPAEHPRDQDGPARRHPSPPPSRAGWRSAHRPHAPVESARGAVPGLLPARFPEPLAEPAVPNLVSPVGVTGDRYLLDPEELGRTSVVLVISRVFVLQAWMMLTVLSSFVAWRPRSYELSCTCRPVRAGRFRCYAVSQDAERFRHR